MAMLKPTSPSQTVCCVTRCCMLKWAPQAEWVKAEVAACSKLNFGHDLLLDEVAVNDGQAPVHWTFDHGQLHLL